uniref:Interleukin 17 receptor B n=1 Tax=Pelusios castaneus TaxID=367368 RepID=A0A8C8RLA8_9SAUR
ACGAASGVARRLHWRPYRTPASPNPGVEQPVQISMQIFISMNTSFSSLLPASIKELTATKICVISKGIREHFECVRCNYTEKFQTNVTIRTGSWEFHYTGFPVEPDIYYFISAYNFPPVNIYEDSPSKSITLISPGCEDNVMKYSKSCIEVGSLWNPNITACKIEAEVEVNFTTSNLGTKYTIQFFFYFSFFLQIIPYFAKCGNDCLRHKGILTQCVQNQSNDTKQTLFHRAELQQPVKVLVIYPKEVCFHHTVSAFAEFLHKRCQSDVIIDMWQKRRIAEQGPVQWLAIQNEIADKVIFLSSTPVSTECSALCHKSVGNHQDNSECMFTLAFNLFCSDIKNRFSLHKYMLVSFNEINSKDTLPSALNTCPKYCLMKDIDIFCRDLSNSHQQEHGTNTKLACGWQPSHCCHLIVPHSGKQNKLLKNERSNRL